MKALKIFASTSGLHPFSLNRVSLTVATMIAALAIAKLVNGYLFCGFNANFYVDLPIAAILFVGYCIIPLLGLAAKREARTKCGRCCRGLAVVLIHMWLTLTYCAAYCIGGFSLSAAISSTDVGRSVWDVDPFNVCGARNGKSVKAEFSNAMPTFETLKRIDFILKLALSLAWLLLLGFSATAWGFLLGSMEEEQRSKSGEAARLEEGDPEQCCQETIVWMEDENEEEEQQFSQDPAGLETISEICDQPAAVEKEEDEGPTTATTTSEELK